MKKGISAIILAAGEGKRMGRIKPLLPLGEGTVIAHVAGSFRAAGIADITVVLGHRCNDIVPELQKNKLRWVVNDHYEKGMLSSVKTGILTLNKGIEAFFVLPADIPLVRSTTLDQLKNAHDPHIRTVVYPAFQGKNGHPPLIPAGYKEAILTYDGPGGLRDCLKAWDSQSRKIAVADRGVLVDMDTPADYDHILARLKNIHIPDPQEAWALLNIHQPGNPRVFEHAQAVAAVAVAIGIALNRTGNEVNLALVEAAGILHDIAKGRPHHALQGAELIAAEGFQAVADVCGQHMDFVFDPSKGIHEADVVFLADKMVSGSEIVPLEKRVQWKKEQFNDEPEVLKRMTFRMKQAIRTRQAIEDLIGEPLEIQL